MPFLDEQNAQTARNSLGGLEKVVTHFIELRLLNAPELQGIIFVLYGVTFQDGLGGDFIWNPTDVTADNGSTVIRPWSVPLANPGRWNLFVGAGGGSGSIPISPGAGVLGVVDSVPLVAAKSVLWELQASKGTTTYTSTIQANNDGATGVNNVEANVGLTPGTGTFDFVTSVVILAGNMNLDVLPSTNGWTFSSKRISQIAP